VYTCIYTFINNLPSIGYREFGTVDSQKHYKCIRTNENQFPTVCHNNSQSSVKMKNIPNREN